MKSNIVLRSPVSARPYDGALCCIPIAAVPYCLGAMRLRFFPYFYTSDADYVRGRSALAELGSGLLMDCSSEIVHAINRLEAWLDVNLTGRVHHIEGTGTEEDPFVITPPLSDTFGAGALPNQVRSIGNDVLWTSQLMENLVTGNTGVTGAAAEPNRLLQAILDALNEAELDEEQIKLIAQAILAALG